MMEAKARLSDMKNIKFNEDSKFSSIKADFENNGLLYKKNYKAKIDELKIVQEDRENKISGLSSKLDEMKNEHQLQLDIKNKMLVQIYYVLPFRSTIVSILSNISPASSFFFKSMNQCLIVIMQ